jgi:hypothetical protein
MKRSVEILGGGVLGLALGTVFLAHPIASAMTTYAQGDVEPGRMSVRCCTRSQPPRSCSAAAVSTPQHLRSGAARGRRPAVQGCAARPVHDQRKPASMQWRSCGFGSQVVTTTDDGVATGVAERPGAVTASHRNRRSALASAPGYNAIGRCARACGHSAASRASRRIAAPRRSGTEPPSHANG